MELLPTFLKKLGIAIAVAIGVGFLSSVLLILYINDFFPYWRSLGRPPEKITRIVGTTPYSVTVETTSKTLYALDTSTRNSLWQKVSIIQDESHNYPGCETHTNLLIKDVLDSKVSCDLSPGGATLSIYALRRNGNIYLWYQYQGGGEFDYWIIPLLFIITFPIGFMVGFVGTWFYFAISLLRKLL